jgi:hypothetical protein
MSRFHQMSPRRRRETPVRVAWRRDSIQNARIALRAVVPAPPVLAHAYRIIELSLGDGALHLSPARSHPCERVALNADAIALNADAIAREADAIASNAGAIASKADAIAAAVRRRADRPCLRLSTGVDALGNDRTNSP